MKLVETVKRLFAKIAEYKKAILDIENKIKTTLNPSEEEDDETEEEEAPVVKKKKKK